METRKGRTWLAAMFMCVSPIAMADGMSPAPDNAEADPLMAVPTPWREYLMAARTAEQIVDPLQRCLAFPDLPGNKWPAGHAEAHCRFHFAHEKITPTEIEVMLDKGELEELEKQLDERLALHFSDTDYSEIIHEDLYFWVDEEGRNGRIAEKWLQLAPHSAYANVAYANFLLRSAWKARGGNYSSETPRENLRRMSALVDQAIPYFDRAISINPKMMPAYAGLIDLAALDSRDDLGRQALAAAKKVDPASGNIASMHMRSLTPRWGGSYEQMLAYANELSAHVTRRPQLAVYMTRPYADRGDRLIADGKITDETLKVLDIAVGIGSDENALRDAANASQKLAKDELGHIKALAYLLQDSRFSASTAWGVQQLAWYLSWREPQWSLKYALKSIELDPDSALPHYLAGRGLLDAGRFEEADREYRIALEDAGLRQGSLRDVASMWLYRAGLDDAGAAAKSGPYIDRLQREYPDDGWGMIMRLHHDWSLRKGVTVAEMRGLLERIDRSDPWQAAMVEGIETTMNQAIEAAKSQPTP